LARQNDDAFAVDFALSLEVLLAWIAGLASRLGFHLKLSQVYLHSTLSLLPWIFVIHLIHIIDSFPFNEHYCVLFIISLYNILIEIFNNHSKIRHSKIISLINRIKYHDTTTKIKNYL